MSYTCSKDPAHLSDDSDYCSICGAPISKGPSAGASAPTAPSAPAASFGGSDLCPDCGTPRSNGAVFCEVCRYNFDLRQSYGAVPAITAPIVTPPTTAPNNPTFAPAADTPVGPVPGIASSQQSPPDPIADPAVQPDPSPASSTDVAVTPVFADATARFDGLVRVDPALYVYPDPEVPCPVGDPDRHFPLDFAENLIGRRSEKRGIFPEIALNDPGVSHRHAKILVEPVGIYLLDIGSTNGTQLNGQDVPANVKTPLKGGDSITLGCWTRIDISER